LPSMVPFRVKAYFEATSARLTTDSAVDSKPTLTIGYANQDEGCVGVYHGVINNVAIRLNPTNAVTYQFELVADDAGASNSYRLRADNLFKSWDNSVFDVAAGADDVEYKWEGLEIPFLLGHIGDIFYNIDWSAAPGNTTGYIMIGGWREIT
jgi:hypothetical protein